MVLRGQETGLAAMVTPRLLRSMKIIHEVDVYYSDFLQARSQKAPPNVFKRPRTSRATAHAQDLVKVESNVFRTSSYANHMYFE
jgi:hypothetical protein